jgi:alanyl-tRNA synthetase
VLHILETDDAKDLGRLLQALIAVPNVVALLGWLGDGRPRWAAGRSSNVPLDMLESLKEVKESFDVQGGGSAQMIQGAAADEDTLHKVLHLLQAFAFDLPDID